MTPYYDNDGITLYRGDCLVVMQWLAEQGVKVDATITDIPYGTTACSWDTVIPFVDMWRNIKALNKPKAATVLFGSEPFSSTLRMSNFSEYKYDWKWYKNNPTGFQLANTQPMRATEDIAVFYSQQCVYNKQLMKTRITDRIVRNGQKNGRAFVYKHDATHGMSIATEHAMNEDVTPWNVLEYDVVPRATGTGHGTQKPVALMQYLIRTYTNPGDTVLDFTCGSGTTLLAAKLEGRKCIGIERDTGKDGECLGYCEYAVSRLAQSCMVFV